MYHSLLLIPCVQLFNWFHYHSLAPWSLSVFAFLLMLYSINQQLNGNQASVMAVSPSKIDSFPHAVLPMPVSQTPPSHRSLVSNR